MRIGTRGILAALFLLPLILSFLPGVPVHGFGHVWLLLPAWFWYRHPRHRKRLSLYVLGLLLQTLAFPEPDLGFLGWALLVPYLIAREQEDGASWWRAALLYGFLRAHAGFYWLGNIHYLAWLGVSLGSGFFFVVCFEGVLRWGRALPYALRVGIGWVFFELAHSWFAGGLPWLYLAHTQYAYPVLIQIADLVGAYGLSFLMAYVQGAALRGRVERYVAAALLLLCVGYALLRPVPRWTDLRRPAVLMVQTAIPHSMKEEALRSVEKMRELLQEMHDTLRRLTVAGLREHPEAELIVWPETLFALPYVENDPIDEFDFQVALEDCAVRFRRPAIYGVNSYTDPGKYEDFRGHNSAILVDEQARVRGIYRKQRLVPVGEEFLPRRVLDDETATRLFWWLVRVLGYHAGSDLEAGEGHATLEAGPGLSCAVLICFEGLYPHLARGALREGDPDLLLHLVNNGWFGASWEERQSVASWVFRAVETRTPFLSCANGGITCAIGPDGRVLGRVDEVMGEGVLLVRVPPRWPEPVFLRGGHLLLPLALALAAAWSLLAAWWRGRRPASDGAG